MTLPGFLFARINRLLPGKSGVAKGATFGLIGWVLMGLFFFPAIGLGPFAIGAGSGLGPALLSFMMLQAYSIVLGTVYGLLDRPTDDHNRQSCRHHAHKLKFSLA